MIAAGLADRQKRSRVGCAMITPETDICWEHLIRPYELAATCHSMTCFRSAWSGGTCDSQFSVCSRRRSRYTASMVPGCGPDCMSAAMELAGKPSYAATKFSSLRNRLSMHLHPAANASLDCWEAGTMLHCSIACLSYRTWQHPASCHVHACELCMAAYPYCLRTIRCPLSVRPSAEFLLSG